MIIKSIHASVDVHREIPDDVKKEDLFRPDYYLTLNPHLRFVIHEFNVIEEREEFYLYKDKERHHNNIKVYKKYDKGQDENGVYDYRRGNEVLDHFICHDLKAGRASCRVYTIRDDIESVKEELAAFIKQSLLNEMKHFQQLTDAIDNKNSWKVIQ